MPSAKRFDITAADDVFIGEHKLIVIDVVEADGDAYAMTGKTLEWVLRQGSGGAVILTKSGAAITITDGAGTNDRAIIEIDALDSISALDVILIDPGRYFHTLRQTDTGDEAVLSYGDFVFKGPATR